MMLGTREWFTYLGCPHCGCLQLADVPSDLGAYYPKSYYSYTDGAWRPGGRGAVRLALALVRFLGPTHPATRGFLWPSRTFREICCWLAPTGARFSDRVLDIGCGAGVVLKKLQAFGFKNLTGIDFFIDGDLRLGTSARVYRRSVEEQTGSFELIMAHHAFEHMPRPLETLQAIRRLLAPRGVVLLRIPLAHSEAFQRYGADWVQLDPPRHLFLHTPKSIEILAARADLEVSQIRYDSNAFQFYGSEFYRRDLPLTDPQTGRFRDPRSLFTQRQIAGFAAEARQLNREGRGDQACFYLRARAG